jgi:D-serine deaminase-like pyridoxal phosphate-dependent protein
MHSVPQDLNPRLRGYGDQIGHQKSEVITPALLLDLEAVRRNCKVMSDNFTKLPASLRPHSKAHKCPKLTALEIAAGAVGVTCATVWEAELMAAAGIEDILIANQVVHPEKLKLLADIASEHRITVAADDARNVEELEAAAARVGAHLEVFIEIDIGMRRAGVRSPEDALPVAEAIQRAAHLELRGLQGYEGHCMGEIDREARDQKTRIANERLIEAADYLSDHGHACRVLSGGGTGTYSVTGSNPRITEVQAGSYLLMDVYHERLIPGEFEAALTVLGSVVSRQGTTVVLDAGRKAIGTDHVMPRLVAQDGGTVRSVAEEHCVVDFDRAPSLQLGDTVEIVPGYAPTTVNLHEAFHVVESGTVTEIWEVGARPRMAHS